jgi:hypothetical protein
MLDEVQDEECCGDEENCEQENRPESCDPEKDVSYAEPLQNLLDAVQTAITEAQVCFDTGNKSAGRRARKALGEIKKSLTPLRATVLEKMKGE